MIKKIKTIFNKPENIIALGFLIIFISIFCILYSKLIYQLGIFVSHFFKFNIEGGIICDLFIGVISGGIIALIIVFYEESKEEIRINQQKTISEEIAIKIYNQTLKSDNCRESANNLLINYSTTLSRYMKIYIPYLFYIKKNHQNLLKIKLNKKKLNKLRYLSIFKRLLILNNIL